MLKVKQRKMKAALLSTFNSYTKVFNTMTTAEKFYKNFLDNYSGSYGADFDAYMYDLGERISIVWSGEYYEDNMARFEDGSEIAWNYKNEIEIY